MARKQVYTLLSSLTAAIHFSIILLYIACIFLMILFKELRFYIALFFCLMWIQLVIFKGCSLTQLESYFLKKGGKKYEDVFFINRLAHGLFKKRFRMSPSQVKLFIQRVIWFFFIVSVIIIVLHFC